ncbi:MAG: DUF934 domain-containing protein [Pseudomonadota bacterium]
MGFIVTRDGVSEQADSAEARDFVSFEDLPGADGQNLAVAVPNSASVDELAPHFERIELIQLHFPSFADGRAFSQAQRLRTLGFEGRIQGTGPIVSDQLRAVFQMGFDEIVVDDAIAARQPAEHWKVRPQGSYQSHILA